MLSVEVYEELTTRRRNAAAQAAASVRAEGLTPSAAVEVIIEQWVHGHLSAQEMEQQVAALYGLPE